MGARCNNLDKYPLRPDKILSTLDKQKLFVYKIRRHGA